MRLLTCTLLCVLVTGATACGDGRAGSPVELTAGDACGDVFFWAATGSGDVAVTVRIDARDRSTVDETTREFVIPDPAVSVEVLEGEALAVNFCNDVLSTASEPRRRLAAVAGEGSIRLDPAPGEQGGPGYGPVSGELVLAGLEAEDGTTFGPIRVTSDSVGTQSG